MSESSSARAAQRASGWPYQKCLQWLRAHHGEVKAGEGSFAERAASLWRQLETEPIPKPGTEPFPIGRTGLVAQEVIPSAFREMGEIGPPHAADEDYCVACGGTGFDIDTSDRLVPCYCTKVKEGT